MPCPELKDCPEIPPLTLYLLWALKSFDWLLLVIFIIAHCTIGSVLAWPDVFVCMPQIVYPRPKARYARYVTATNLAALSLSEPTRWWSFAMWRTRTCSRSSTPRCWPRDWYNRTSASNDAEAGYLLSRPTKNAVVRRPGYEPID